MLCYSCSRLNDYYTISCTSNGIASGWSAFLWLWKCGRGLSSSLDTLLNSKHCQENYSCSNIMKSLLIFVIAASLTAASAQDTCSACNCQLSNAQALGQLIRDVVANTTRAGIGATYIRWGRTTCPNTPGTELVYTGNAGGTFWSTTGGAADKVCLPPDPDYLPGTSGLNTGIPSSPHMHGVEYEYLAGPNSNVNQHNAPCAVCFASSRATTLMIPAKTTCPPTWTREYYGYLASERASHPARSVFSCVDNDPEAIGGTQASRDGALFYHVLTTCNGLTCPPYENERALSCVVCTK